MLAQETTNLLSIKHFRTNIEDDDDRELIDGIDQDKAAAEEAAKANKLSAAEAAVVAAIEAE